MFKEAKLKVLNMSYRKGTLYSSAGCIKSFEQTAYKRFVTGS